MDLEEQNVRVVTKDVSGSFGIHEAPAAALMADAAIQERYCAV